MAMSLELSQQYCSKKKNVMQNKTTVKGQLIDVTV